MPDKKTVAVAVLCVLILLFLVVSGYRSLRSNESGSTTAALATQPVAALQDPQPTVERTIHVGYLVSARTGQESGWIGKPYGYGTQMRAVRELSEAGLDLVPIIEPGSATDDRLKKQLQTFENQPIEATDAAALQKLDVIIAYAVWRTDTQTLSSIADAVRGGVGFINVGGVGKEEPGLLPPESAPGVALTGLTMAQYAYSPEPGPCDVLASHPLLGDLKPGDKVTLRPNGNYGPLPAGAVPLLQMQSSDSYRQVGPSAFDDEKTPANFYPLYLVRLGKGRIVCSNFAPYADVPRALKAGNTGYYAKLCRWVVEERDGVQPASTQPAATQPTGVEPASPPRP